MPRTAPSALPAAPSLAAAISPGGLFADAFPGSSWDRWRAILKAASGEPMSDYEIELFREVADRDPPGRRVRECWIIGGRRSGKDSVASAIAVVLALGDRAKHLRPGERATVLCIANTREQGAIVFRMIAALMNESAILRPLIVRETADSLVLSNGAEIVVSSPNYRSVRGRTVVAAILDECAFYADEESAIPDTELYAAILPAMSTIPDALMIGISSPHGRSGLLFQKFAASYGKEDPGVLVVRGASRTFNPTLDEQIVADALARDPERAGAEWLAEWRSDVSDFLSRDLLDAATDQGVIVRPPAPGAQYVAAADPSGGRGDAFAVAIAHAEDDAAVIDAVMERRAPFDPAAVVAEAADLLRSYGISSITGDRYSAGWVAEAFAKEGINYHPATTDKSGIYTDALPLFASGRIRLIDSPRLVHQLASLERRTTRGGRDRVDHPAHGSDDVAHAAALALITAAADTRAGLIRAASFMGADGRPLPVPSITNTLFAVTHVGDDGTAATTFWSQNHYVNPELVLLDYDLRPLDAAIFGEVWRQVQAWAKRCPPRMAAFIYGPAALVHSPWAEDVGEVPPELLTDPTKLALCASVHISMGRVRIAESAAEKPGPSPIRAALEVRLSDALDPRQPLRTSVLLGISLALDKTR